MQVCGCYCKMFRGLTFFGTQCSFLSTGQSDWLGGTCVPEMTFCVAWDVKTGPISQSSIGLLALTGDMWFGLSRLLIARKSTDQSSRLLD